MKNYDGFVTRKLKEAEMMAGIREERQLRKRLGVEESRWMDNPDWDRWDKRVNWCVLAVSVAVMGCGLLLLLPIL